MENKFENDLAFTSCYILHHIMNDRPFFEYVDKCIHVARLFIEKYPTGTNWEIMEDDWESTLHEFSIIEFKKIGVEI
jgi:hypothetical protein